jgi:hypothetical protein
MTKKELRELINAVIKEYMGTGSSGGNAGDGNNITSPRVGGEFPTDAEEKEHYNNKNVYGAEGGHYKKEPAFHNPNRTNFTKF